MAGEIVPARPISTADRVGAIQTLVEAVGPVFNDLADRTFDYPNFIASDEERSPLGAAVRGIARLNCRIWAASDKSNYSTRVNLGNAELCGPYLDDLGENPDDGDIGPEFEGGQCAGINYRVTLGITDYPFSDCSTFGEGVSTNGYTGPIRGIRYGVENPSGDLCTPGRNRAYLQHGPPGNESIVGGAGFGTTVRIINIEREDGLPDDCGDPPPLIRPPATVTPVTPIPPSIVVNLPGLGPVDVTVTINPTGDPEICIPILGVCEVVPVNPGEPGGGEPGGGGGTPPPEPEVGPPQENPPGGGGNGGDSEFGDPPEGRIWIGAYVQLLGPLEKFGIIPGDQVGQAALATVVGNASLTITGPSGNTLRGTHEQLRSEWSEHIVGIVGLQVSGIRVKVNPALGYRVFPVSVVDPALEQTENG